MTAIQIDAMKLYSNESGCGGDESQRAYDQIREGRAASPAARPAAVGELGMTTVGLTKAIDIADGARCQARP